MTFPLEPIVGAPAPPPRVGLLPSLAGGAVVPEGRWAAGVTWEPEGCGNGDAYDPSTCPPDNDIEIPSARDLIESFAFVVWGGDRCSPWELARDWKAKATRQLNATQSYSVAAELWSGAIAQAAGWPNRRLASPDSDVVSMGGPETPTQALACLEEGIARAGKGRRGMIHATPAAVTAWQTGGALRREAGQILTILDTIVVPDAGYDGSGPNGEPATDGSVWAYATEVIGVRLSPIRTLPTDGQISAQNFDRSVNTVLFRAERDVVVLWDQCIHIAVEMNLGLCGIGGS